MLFAKCEYCIYFVSNNDEYGGGECHFSPPYGSQWSLTDKSCECCSEFDEDINLVLDVKEQLIRDRLTEFCKYEVNTSPESEAFERLIKDIMLII